MFLDTRARSLIHLHPDNEARPPLKRKFRAENYPRHPQCAGVTKREKSPQKKAPAGDDKGRLPCKQCSGDHALYRCPQLIDLNLASRQEIVRSLGVCRNCLREHIGQKCSFGPCTKCNPERHNGLLCPKRMATINAVTIKKAKREKKIGQAKTPKPE